MKPVSSSIVPSSDDLDIYLVLDDLGSLLGRIWQGPKRRTPTSPP
jgi:hypothetical protein